MSRAQADRGFTLIEALVALAILAAVLAPLGAIVASNARTVRTASQRIAVAALAQDVLSNLPPRDRLVPGRRSGDSGALRWQLDIAPLPMTGGDAKLMPLTLRLRIAGRGATLLDITTVRLAVAGA